MEYKFCNSGSQLLKIIIVTCMKLTNLTKFGLHIEYLRYIIWNHL